MRTQENLNMETHGIHLWIFTFLLLFHSSTGSALRRAIGCPFQSKDVQTGCDQSTNRPQVCEALDSATALLCEGVDFEKFQNIEYKFLSGVYILEHKVNDAFCQNIQHNQTLSSWIWNLDDKLKMSQTSLSGDDCNNYCAERLKACFALYTIVEVASKKICDIENDNFVQFNSTLRWLQYPFPPLTVERVAQILEVCEKTDAEEQSKYLCSSMIQLVKNMTSINLPVSKASSLEALKLHLDLEKPEHDDLCPDFAKWSKSDKFSYLQKLTDQISDCETLCQPDSPRYGICLLLLRGMEAMSVLEKQCDTDEDCYLPHMTCDAEKRCICQQPHYKPSANGFTCELDAESDSAKVTTPDSQTKASTGSLSTVTSAATTTATKTQAESVCSDEKPCGGENEECKEGVCTCKTTFIKDAEGKCTNVPEAGCSDEKPCTGENQECKDGVCQCKATFTSDAEGKCVADSTEVVPVCSDLKPCVGENEECKDGVCTCKTTFDHDSEGKCASVPDSSEVDPGCSDVKPCVGENEECKEGVCQCKATFTRDAEGKCASAGVSVPEPECDGELKPCADENAECVNEKCVCKASFVLDNDSEKCVQEPECSSPNKNCSGENERCVDGKCECKLHFDRDDSGNCVSEPECGLYKDCDDENAECQDGSCVCKSGYETLDGICETLSVECTQDDDCDEDEECSQGDCVCKYGTNADHNCKPAPSPATSDNSLSENQPESNQEIRQMSVNDEESGGHFMAYFLTAVVMCVAGYIVFHNKQKIIAFIVEGRNGSGGRRPSSKEYRKLKTTVDDVMPALEKSTTPSKYVY